MLVLTRKSGEVLRIGEAVVRLEIKGGKIKVSVAAPKHVKILRDELAAEPTPAEFDAMADPKEGLGCVQ